MNELFSLSDIKEVIFKIFTLLIYASVYSAFTVHMPGFW